MCITVDTLPPYLLNASPASTFVNSRRIWFSFAFSEAVFLLYDPLHSFTENLQTSTAERLLSMVCSPDQTGECISVMGGTVLTTAVEADSIALEVDATAKSRLSLIIPRTIITDMAGNPLRGDVRLALTVNDEALEVTRWDIVLFTQHRFCPFLSLTFNKPIVRVADASTIIVTVQQATGNSSLVVNSQDVIVKPYSIVFSVDDAYRTHAKYGVMIPAGMFSDEYANFFAGYMDDQLTFSSTATSLFYVLLALAHFWFVFAACAVGVGIFLAVAGYRQVYYAVLVSNAVFFMCLLDIISCLLYSLFASLHLLVLLLLLLAVAVVAIACSAALSHNNPGAALRAFTAGLGFYVGMLVFRMICDILSNTTGVVKLFPRE